MTSTKEKSSILRSWHEVIDEPFPELASITEKTRKNIQAVSHRIRGAVRLRLARILTDEKREARRKEAQKYF